MKNKVKRLIQHISTLVRKTHLQNRLLISFSVLLIVPLFVILIFMLTYWNRTIEQKTLENFRTNIQSIGKNIDNLVEMFERLSVQVATNVGTIDVVRLYQLKNRHERFQARASINGIVYDSLRAYSGQVLAAELLSNTESIQFSPTSIINGDAPFSDSEIFSALKNSDEISTWLGIRQLDSYNGPYYQVTATAGTVLILSTKVPDIRSPESVGMFIMAISENVFYETYSEQLSNDANGEYYILDDKGFYISNRDKTLLGTRASTEILNQMDEYNKAPENMHILEMGEENYVMVVSECKANDWKIVYLAREKTFTSTKRLFVAFSISITAIFVVLILFFSFIVTKSITDPIDNITNEINKMQDNNLDIVVVDHANDEISFVAKSINNMINRINKLITQNYTNEINKKEAQLDALESQIDSHFLYNTLDSISWMIYMSDNNEEAGRMLDELASFFRLGLNGGRDYCTLAQEVRHAQSYVSLQSMKYGDIKFQFSLFGGMEKYAVLKLIIQPLIENAIIHGLEPRQGKGSVHITLFRETDFLIIEVDDDGTGVIPDNWEQFEPEKAGKRSGYGIKNINQRIKMYFGEKFGINLYQRNPGVKARVLLPLVPVESIDPELLGGKIKYENIHY